MRKLALRIAREELARAQQGGATLQLDLGVIEVAALLHDVEDYKVCFNVGYIEFHEHLTTVLGISSVRWKVPYALLSLLAPC